MEKYKGIFTALLTPFDKDNKVNETQLEKLIKHNLKMGVKGFYVCGSTGEAFLLSTDERKQVMDIVKSTAPEATLIAHIGSVNEMEAMELANHAKKLSYDAISSVAPFYYKFSFEEIKNYYYRLADSAELPMLVYHIPTFSGVNMGIREMSQFLADGRFLGIKYTSNDFFTMEQCKANFPEKIVYNGFDEMFVRINQCFDAQEVKAAQEIQKQANRIITVLWQIGVMQAEKEVLNQLGFDFGICRHPFGELTQEQKERIGKEIIPFVSA